MGFYYPTSTTTTTLICIYSFTSDMIGSEKFQPNRLSRGGRDGSINWGIRMGQTCSVIRSLIFVCLCTYPSSILLSLCRVLRVAGAWGHADCTPLCLFHLHHRYNSFSLSENATLRFVFFSFALCSDEGHLRRGQQSFGVNEQQLGKWVTLHLVYPPGDATALISLVLTGS